MQIEAIERTAVCADAFAARENAPAGILPMGNLIRHAAGPVGYDWIASNCEAQAEHQERDDHAAQFRVIAKRLRRAMGGAS